MESQSPTQQNSDGLATESQPLTTPGIEPQVWAAMFIAFFTGVVFFCVIFGSNIGEDKAKRSKNNGARQAEQQASPTRTLEEAQAIIIRQKREMMENSKAIPATERSARPPRPVRNRRRKSDDYPAE